MLESALHFDPHQFSGRHAYAVSKDSHITFNDYSRMSTRQHLQSGERRLPTPAWALDDNLLKNLLVVFIEQRLGICNPQGTLIERREFARQLAIADRPRHAAKLDELNQRYVDEKKNGAPPERLAELGSEIEGLDSYIRTTENGGMDLVAAVCYLYHRCKLDSVGVGEELRIKPPHCRQILWRMEQIWKKRFNEDGTLKPPAPPRSARPPVVKPPAPPRESKLTWSLPEAVLLRLFGCSFEEIGARLGVSFTTVYMAFKRYEIVVERPKAIAKPRKARLRKWDINEARALLNIGFSVPEIASALGVTKPAIYIVFRKLGLTRKPSVDWEKAFELRKGGMTFREIAAQLGVSIDRVFDACKKKEITPRKSKSSREALKATGICVDCKKRPATPDYVSCAECRAYYNGMARNYMAKKKAGQSTPGPVQEMVCA
jgi:transposase